MKEGGAQRVARYCTETVGEKLRSVSEYDETGVTTVYSRPGLREDYTDEQAAALLETAMEQNQRLHRSNIEGAPLGEPRAAVYAFEEAFVVQLPVSETEGIVVTMDADVGTQLGGFVRALRARMTARSSGSRDD
jgi:hypothetical protein